MISLSFGFNSLDKVDLQEGGIVDEIKNCVNKAGKPILIFASASNDTNEGQRTWPASNSGVICVYSAKFWGGKSDYNPPTEEGFNFGFVGEEIRPAWGRRELQDYARTTYTKMDYKSGTSYATPVAVSCAAFIIGFMNLMGWSNWTCLHDPRTWEGMERLLGLMSTPVDDKFDWVSLTRYFSINKIDHIRTDFERVLKRQDS
jgi:hypothetical protein